MRLRLLARTYTSMPKCDFVPNTYKGLSREDLVRIRNTRLSPALKTFYRDPLVLQQGHKQWVFDADGRRYLDMLGGICTVSVGHCHEKVTEAANEQMKTLVHVSNVYMHPKIHEYAERLTDKLPGDLKVVYFVNSGSEANDLAVLIARTYTENYEILALRNAYHGMTCQVMGLTSSPAYRYPVPHPPGFYYTMNPDVYQGLWGGKACRYGPIQTTRLCACTDTCAAGEKYLEQLEEVFRYHFPRGKAAAFFAESIQGVGGVVQYPKNFARGADNLIKSYGGLYVADEVQTGFGRTGDHFWGFQMHGIVPDVVTMAKGIGNGFPLAAVVTTPTIAKSLTKAEHFNTFGGNPVACAVGLAVLDIIDEEDLQENSKRVGTHLLKRLAKLRDKSTHIGDVRGTGLMIGMELVRGDGTTSPIEPARFLHFWERCRDLGVLIGKGGSQGNVVRVKPPMCITIEDADFAADVFEKVLDEMVSEN